MFQPSGSGAGQNFQQKRVGVVFSVGTGRVADFQPGQEGQIFQPGRGRGRLYDENYQF